MTEQDPAPNRSRYRWGVIAALCVAAALAGLELGCRFLPYLVPARVSVVQLDRSTLISRVPGSRFIYRHKEFRNEIEYNRSGLRGPEVSPANLLYRRRIAFLGDSFTEAVEVPWEKTWVALTGKALGAEALDFGVGGYSVAQAVASYGARARQFQPLQVVLQIYSNDWAENLNPAVSRLYRIEPSEPVRAVFTPLPDGPGFRAAAWLAGYSHFFMHLSVTWDRFIWPALFPGHSMKDPDRLAREDKVMLALLETAAQQVGADGARLYILLVPGVPDGRVRLVNDFAVKNRVPLFDIGPYEADAAREGAKWHWQYDGHFNETGNREVAQLVADWLR